MAVLPPRQRRFHPLARALIVVAAGLAVYGLLAWLALPPLLRGMLEERGSQELGRTVSVASVDVNPWTLSVEVKGLVISAAPDAAPGAAPAVAGASPAGPAASAAAPQVQVERLLVNLSLASLWRLAPVLDALQVDRPVLRVSRLPEGGFDFDDVVQRLSGGEPAAPSQAPARFALHNIQITDGQLTFEDRASGQRHVVDRLNVGLPFISSLDSARDVTVLPTLSFLLDGRPVQSTAESLPFASSRKTAARLRLDALPIEPYLAYLPSDLPVRVEQGRLSLDLAFTFEQDGPQPQLDLSGTLQLDEARVGDAGGSSSVAVAGVTASLAGLDPIARRVHLSALDIKGIDARFARDATGRLPWQSGAAAPAGTEKTAAPADRAGDGAGDQAGDKARDGAAWALQLDHLVVRDSAVAWADAGVQPAVDLALGDIALDVQDLAWPMTAPATVRFAARQAQAHIQVEGSGTDQQADLRIQVHDFALAGVSSYLEGLRARPEGALSFDGQLAWKGGDRVQVQVAEASVAGFALHPESAARTQGAVAEPGWSRLAVRDARIDTEARTAQLGAVTLEQPRLLVSRGSDGRWMYEDWWQGSKAVKTVKARDMPATPTPPWRWSIGSAAVKGATLHYSDGAQQPAVGVAVRALDLDVGPWASSPVASSPIRLSAEVASVPAVSARAGRVQLSGHARDIADGVPRRFDAAKVDLQRLPLHALAPYIPALAALDVRRADASFAGSASYQQLAAGPRVAVKGDAKIEGLRADQRRPSALDAQARRAWAAQDHQLVSWRGLQLDGVDFAMAPGAATRLNVAGSSLVDLFARLVITPQGQLNLQGLYAEEAGEGGAAPELAQPQADAEATAPPAASRPVVSRAAAAGPAAPASGAADPALVLNLGPTRIVNGRIAFNDQFVRPNYSANLSQLTGKLGAISSVPSADGPQLADLELQGLAQETAELIISGKLNPLAQPLVLDIRGQVRDLDLAPLSPYSVKYAGYGIERGKLNVDVRYQIDGQGQLTATNKLVLNQLTFGDKTGESSLPVKLAVALLADRNGVIDVELPVSGSINDPQFSIGGLIWRAVGSLLAKAVTAPFSLLTSAFGSGGSAGQQDAIAFGAGISWLDAPAQATLDKLAQALVDRPSLQITLGGRASFEAERVDFQRAELARRVARAAASGRPAASPPAGQTAGAGQAGTGDAAASAASADAAGQWLPPQVPTGEAYAQALERLYRRSDVDKPRNLIGMAKSLPVADMEKLIMADIPATPENLQKVAAERAVAVRSYLMSRGVPASRIYLGPARLEDAPATGGWTPRVEIKLDLR
ncbi:MAG: DUF748 domain-containing protein [Comamonas sp.]